VHDEVLERESFHDRYCGAIMCISTDRSCVFTPQGSGSGKLGSNQNLLVRGGSKGEIGKSQISAVEESSSSPVLKSRDSGGCEAPSPLCRPEGSERRASGLFGQESLHAVGEAEMGADLQVAVLERSDIFGTAEESTSWSGFDLKNDDQQNNRLFSARALTDCELIVVPSDDLQSAMAAGNLVLNGRLWLSLLSEPTPRKSSSLLIAQLLNSCPLFSPLAHKHRVEFSKTVQMLTLEKGDLICVQGENSQTAEYGVCGFLVVAGLVSVHAFEDARHVDKERYLEHSKSQGLIETCFGAR
jgi:CRP-like cAMP-binding protein